MTVRFKLARVVMLLPLALGACQNADMSAQIQEKSTPDGRLRHAERELAAASATKRVYRLGDAAKAAFDRGDFAKAARYADELERLTASSPHDWNYGNAIQDVNLVHGRLALRAGKKDAANAFLLAAGRSPGSPQMDSFGPNMSLANDLLRAGERDVVIEYFDLCRVFWRDGHPLLDQWTADVRAGRTPQFGANLVY